MPGTTVPIFYATQGVSRRPPLAYVMPVRKPSEEELANRETERRLEEAQADEIEAVIDPEERLVRALAAFAVVREEQVTGPDGTFTPTLTVFGHRRSNLFFVDVLCPDWRAKRWDDEHVAEWFAQAARERGIEPQVRLKWPEPKRGIFGNIRQQGGQVMLREGPTVDAWVIPPELVEWSPTMQAPAEALIADDGELYVGYLLQPAPRQPQLEPGGRLRHAALIYLADLLGFPVKQRRLGARPVARPEVRKGMDGRFPAD